MTRLPTLRAAAVALGALFTGRLARYEIADHSMEPTLHGGDWVLAHRSPRRVTPGSVVVFPHPEQPDALLVKRVASMADGRLTVVGDRRDHSADSRAFGPIPRDQVEAVVLLVYHPGRPRAVPPPA